MHSNTFQHAHIHVHAPFYLQSVRYSHSLLQQPPAHVPLAMSRARQFLTPRVLAPVLLWTLSIWLIHTYLFELSVFPAPLWRSAGSDEAAAHRLSPEFPAPMDREGEDWIDSVDPRRRPFSPHGAPRDPFPKLRPTRFLPDHCLEEWFMTGETMCGRAELRPEDTLDATWLWVNGSDQRWADEMRLHRAKMGVKSPSRHFRWVQWRSSADTAGSRTNSCTRCDPSSKISRAMSARST